MKPNYRPEYNECHDIYHFRLHCIVSFGIVEILAIDVSTLGRALNIIAKMIIKLIVHYSKIL